MIPLPSRSARHNVATRAVTYNMKPEIVLNDTTVRPCTVPDQPQKYFSQSSLDYEEWDDEVNLGDGP